MAKNFCQCPGCASDVASKYSLLCRKLWEPKLGGQATPDPGSSDWYHWLAARAHDKTAQGKAVWRAGGTLQREQLKAFEDHIVST